MDLTEQVANALVTNWPLVLGLVIIVTWFLKTFFPHILDKKGDVNGSKHAPTSLMVQLDPQVSGAIYKTAEAIRSVSEIVERKDEAGTPLVYADRRQEHAVLKIADILKEIAEAQRHLADIMTRLDIRFEARDKSDSIMFSRMADTMIRIETIAQDNREAMIGSSRDHQSTIKSLDEVKAMHLDHDKRVMQAVALQEEIRSSLGKKRGSHGP